MIRVLLCFLLAVSAMQSAKAQEVVADISEHLVAISTGFTGSKLLLFGAMEKDAKVIVVVRGPDGPVTMRRKGRVAGIWMNKDSLKFETVPSYYAVLTSHPINEIIDETTAMVQEIGFDHLVLRPEKIHEAAYVIPFREALVRKNTQRNLFQIGENEIEIIRDKLFRTDVHFPANAPVGSYWIQVYLFVNGDIVSAQSSVLPVGKVGMTENIYNLAHDYGLLYGLLAVFIAVVAGWIASVVFRKR